MTPTRSWMFVPGNMQRFLNKARTSEADGVFLDLEDGVLPDNKPTARSMIASVLDDQDWSGPLRFVRTNAVGTPWFEDDLDAVLRPGLQGLCLPKVEDPETVRAVHRRLSSAENRLGVEHGQIRVVAAIESAAGILAAPAIANSSSRVLALMFGAEDFALDLGLGTHREAEAAEFIHARSAIVTACAAAHVLSIDGVFPNLDDREGLLADVTQARRLGFGGKSTFNPRQVNVINRIFSPQPDEVSYARRVVDAFAEAKARGDASVAVGGQLVDLPILRRAESILALAGDSAEVGA